MKEIRLSCHGKNRGKYVALIDDEDYERVNQFKWCVYKNGKNLYAQRAILIEGVKSAQSLHRFIMNAQSADPQIDHKDGNGLNNQKLNLRFCTHGENMANSKPRIEKSSIYKGVLYHSRDKKYAVSIQHNKKRINLGYFDNEIDAAKVYDKKALELFGEFARPNFK
jgi:hypothetical protein